MHMHFRDYATAAELMLELRQSGHVSTESWMLNFIANVYNRDEQALDDWMSAAPIDDTTQDLLRRFLAVHLHQQTDPTLPADISEYFWGRPDYPFGHWMLGRLGAHDRVFAHLNSRLDNGRLLELRGLWTPDLETRNQPGFEVLLNRIGLLDYWDSSGWGSVCVPAGDGMDCAGNSMTPEHLRSLLAGDRQTP
jgi:hypothetical protein